MVGLYSWLNIKKFYATCSFYLGMVVCIIFSVLPVSAQGQLILLDNNSIDGKRSRW